MRSVFEAVVTAIITPLSILSYEVLVITLQVRTVLHTPEINLRLPPSDPSKSISNRYRARSATVTITRLCCLQNRMRSGTRAMVPSSLTISQITPAGYKPARLARSTAASVWPASFQDASCPSAKRKNVARPREVFRATVRIDCGLDRLRPIVCRDAGCHARRLGID